MPLPNNVNHVHFVGIGGYGMSALALILLQKGYRVSGSDMKYNQLTATLSSSGALVSIGHSAGNLGAAQMVVYSTAVPTGNPELVEAGRRGIFLWHRSELLAALLNEACGIAIAGAHGKTTTTAMTALLLEKGGLDPTAIIGGVLPAYGSNARLGKSPYLVAEADESDSSFTRYYPQLALVTGIEADHLEHYNNDYNSLVQAYWSFLSNLAEDGKAVLNGNDPALVKMGAGLNNRAYYYGITSDARETGAGNGFSDGQQVVQRNPSTANQGDHTEKQGFPAGYDYYAANIALEDRGAVFDFYHRGDLMASAVKLVVPGLHNVSNATGALGLVHTLGLDPAACAPVLSNFSGVGRRFELIGVVSGVTVIDDYAHHPTEIKATLRAARPSCKGRLICLFQPHRYTRTAFFFDEFARSFADADLLLLHSVYSAGEVPIPGATSEHLAEQIRHYSNIPVFQSDYLDKLEEQALIIARSGDVIITMGAGDVTNSAPGIVRLLHEKEES